MISLFVPVITPPAPLLTANKRLCVCRGIRVTLRSPSPSVSFSHPTPLLTTTTFSCVLLLSPPLLLRGVLPVVYVLQAGVG